MSRLSTRRASTHFKTRYAQRTNEMRKQRTRSVRSRKSALYTVSPEKGTQTESRKSSLPMAKKKSPRDPPVDRTSSENADRPSASIEFDEQQESYRSLSPVHAPTPMMYHLKLDGERRSSSLNSDRQLTKSQPPSARPLGNGETTPRTPMNMLETYEKNNRETILPAIRQNPSSDSVSQAMANEIRAVPFRCRHALRRRN